jgi:hypothetical protein
MFWAGWSGAMIPENGVWWNPSESGTGYNFEIQNNVFVMYAYTFEPDGRPLFLYTGGAMTGDNQFSGTLMRAEGGQCITCAYRPATSAAYGTVQVVFDSPSTATMTFNGTRSTRVQRFAYGVNEASPYKVFGEWSFVTGSASSPVYFGERLGFANTFTTTDGYLMASGSRTGAASNVAIARFDGSTWYILLDTSPSYYDFYSFGFSGLNTMEGRVWTFLKGSSLQGGGLPFIGQRSGSYNSVANGTGPSLQKSANLSAMTSYDSVAASKAQLSSVETYEQTDMQRTERARQMLEQMLR